MNPADNERIEVACATVRELGRAIRALECEQDEAINRYHQAIVDASDTPINDERQMMLEAA